MAEFKVLRRHDGDKEYHAGDTRTADAADVAHLVKLGVLEQVEEKAAKASANKADPSAANQADKPIINKPAPAAANKMSATVNNKADSK